MLLVCPQVTGMTPLMYAVKDNRASLLDRIVELGADVCARNNVSKYCGPYKTLPFIRTGYEPARSFRFIHSVMNRAARLNFT
jgi:hypothetical protein